MQSPNFEILSRIENTTRNVKFTQFHFLLTLHKSFKDRISSEK